MRSARDYIDKLEELKENSESILKGAEPDSIWENDIEVLDEMIERLKGEYIVGDPAETIRKILKDRGMSQQQLADNMGATRQNVSQMLNRGSTAPRFDSFAKMTAGLGCEIVIRPILK